MFFPPSPSARNHRFRQEYRLERKLVTELAIDPDDLPEDSLDHILATSPTKTSHRISRVVVLHNDKLETFVDPETAAADPYNADSPVAVSSNDFFDNESFWSGSITWY